jgi:hypothetical protein
MQFPLALWRFSLLAPSILSALFSSIARYTDCKIYLWNKKSQPIEDGLTALVLSVGLRSRRRKEIIRGKVSSFIPIQSFTNHRASSLQTVLQALFFKPQVSVYFRSHKQIYHSAENINILWHIDQLLGNDSVNTTSRGNEYATVEGVRR